MTELHIAFEITQREQRIEKIRQIIFDYDNLPPDGKVVEYIKEWRQLNKEIKELKWTRPASH